jgi:hypothetical protein
MKPPLDWHHSKTKWIRLLQESTGEDLETWNERIEREQFSDEYSLRAWLTQEGVTGYAQTLLVMKRFGYPDFLVASAEQLINGQYQDRAHLRPILDAILDAVSALGEVTVQARKTYVSLVTPRRTFARVQAKTKNRIDLALRLDEQEPGGLQPSKVHETMKHQISFGSLAEVDGEALSWLKREYEQNV